MSRIVGSLSLALMLASFTLGAAAETDLVKTLSYGVTLAMMPVSACAWIASIAFIPQATSKA